MSVHERPCRTSQVAAGSALQSAGTLIAEPIALLTPAVPDALKGRLWKTLKIGMVNVPGSLTDKFKAAKAAGFDGIEMNAKGITAKTPRSMSNTSTS